MSVFSDIEDWVKDQLETEVTAFTSVVAIAEPEEFKVVGRNAPAAGVLVIAGDATDEMTFGGDQLITVNVGVWVSSHTFRGGEDLSNDNGLHELFDSIHAAFKDQVPTSAFDPLRYVGHRLEEIEDGLAVMVMQYITGVII